MNGILKALFDASSLINFAATGGSEALNQVKEGSAISLTFYELGNAAWKLYHLLKKLNEAEAKALLSGSLKLYDLLGLLELDRNQALDILHIAAKKRITFYDCAYVYAAKLYKLPLVTDDVRLGKIAKSENLETFSSRSLS